MRPTLCLVNKTGSIDDIPVEPRVAVNGKYEFTSRNYLGKSDLFVERTPRIVIYNGDLENRVVWKATDCGIDMVYEGKTIDKSVDENGIKTGLKVIQKIRFSNLVLISPLKKNESLFGMVMRKEYDQIAARALNPTDSLTSQLLRDPEALAKKGAAEWIELALAMNGAGKDPFIVESADIFYVNVVSLVQQGVTLDELARYMSSRQK